MSTQNSVLSALVRRILSEPGAQIALVAEGDVILPRTYKASEVKAGAASVDEVALRAYVYGERAGSFLLVWGNAPDGSELIADHTANAYCEAIYEAVAA